ncbi:MAG TPA: cupredoxin domain-containing protein [Myxococcales bacterium]
MKKTSIAATSLLVLAALAVAPLIHCAGRSEPSYAEKVYVAPGQLDKYYAFLSGGQSGAIFVTGIPSGRHLRTIPVFEPRYAYGYGEPGTKTYEMLEKSGGFWGDAHHPALSETGGDFDGRWLFINDKAHGRVGKIDLKTFDTVAITKIPNLQGAHGIAIVSPDSRYLFVDGELEVPVPNHFAGPEEYHGMMAFLDPATMEVRFEVLMPGNADIADASKDGHYAFCTVYNTERGIDPENMIRQDRDAVAAVDIPLAEKALKENKDAVSVVNGIPILDPAQVPGLLTLIPVPKNPHGCNVTPEGKYVLASGKLSPTVTIIDAHTLKIVAEPQVGLGPLHTTFDDRGNAYTSLFIDSQIVKWNIEKAVKGDPDYIVDRVDVHYNVGHTKAVGADTMHPAGDWLISLNKLSKDQYLPVGPAMPENQELIDISGKHMHVALSFPTDPEPHDAQFILASKLAGKVMQTYDQQPGAVKPGEERIERTGPHAVHAYMTAVRSKFVPGSFEVREGDKVTLTVTNIEHVRDMTHGFALTDHEVNLAIDPGQTQEVTFEAGKQGIYWFYCTWFCSALHLEMRGRMIVKAAGEETATGKVQQDIQTTGAPEGGQDAPPPPEHAHHTEAGHGK